MWFTRFGYFTLLDSVSSDLRDLPNLASFLPRFSIYSAYTLLSYRIEDHKYNLHGPCETWSCCNSSRTTTILLRRVIFHAKHSFFPASILSKTCFFFRTSMPFVPISISMPTTFRSRRSTVLRTILRRLKLSRNIGAQRVLVIFFSNIRIEKQLWSDIEKTARYLRSTSCFFLSALFASNRLTILLIFIDDERENIFHSQSNT